MGKTFLRAGGIVGLLAAAACQDDVIPTQPGRMSPASGPSYTIANGAQLKDSVENAPTGAVISIGSGDYYLPSQILIDGKTNITIKGLGIGVTRIHASDTATFAFKVGDNVNGLTIQDMTIVGSGPASENTHGIGMFSGVGRSAMTFQRLELKELSVGISVAGSAQLQVDTGASGCDDVTIFGNTIVGVRARQHPTLPAPNTSGSGYAIHNQGCTRVRIAENYIEDSERHGIYQAWSKGTVTIEHNFILNHMRTTPSGLQTGQNLVALAVTNTENATVAFNTVVNSRADAMSLEYENVSDRPAGTSNVQLIGNTIIGSHYQDLFVSAPGTWQIWGNKYVHRGTIGESTTPTVRHNNQSFSLDTATTSYSTTWSRWWGTKAVVANTPGSDVYVFQNDHMHKVTKSFFSHPNSWNYTSYKGPYYGMQSVAVDANYAYVMASNTLYALTPSASPWTERASSTNWSGFEAMATTGGELYIVQSGYLHHVDPVTFSWSSPSPRSGWQNTQALTGFNGRLFLYQNDCIHEVSTSTLWYTRYYC